MTLPKLARTPVSAFLATAALVVGGLTTLSPQSVSAQTLPSVAPSVRGLPDFTDLVDLVGPSVVNIRTLERASADTGSSADEQMLEFFKRFGIPIPPGMTPRGPRQERGPSDELIVTLTDKRELKAKVVGADKRTDVAVVKIEATGLNAVKIGDINRLRVGEWVMAIGSPFGLENSVTAVIVSAKKRDTGDFLPFIQTDVAINPGNSGGPLINMRCEVVGINSQIYSRSGGFQGISFAIPIDEAVRVSDQLRTSGRVTRGRIGVQIDQVSKEVAESIGLGQPRGALVRGVEPNSPAAKAGVEPGDIVLKFDGKEVDKSVDLPRLVGNTKPGNKSSMTVFRRGAQRELAITVAELDPDQPQRRAAAPDAPKPPVLGAAQSLGLTLAELTPAQKKELNVKGGVRVEAAEGPAAKAGLREGDVIVAIANTEVASAKELEAAVARLDKSRPVNVLFRRGEWGQYAVIRPQR